MLPHARWVASGLSVHCGPHRPGDRFGGRHPEPVGVGGDVAGGQHGGEVAVVAGVGRADRLGQAVVGRLGQQVTLGLGQPARRWPRRPASCARTGSGPGTAAPSDGAVDPARMRPSAPITSPAGLQATRAPTVASPSRTAAVPRPPGTAYSRPRHFPTVAPRPAPIRPETAGSPRAASTAAAHPSSGPGVRATGRSNRAAATTIGTTPAEVGKPWPRSARNRMTPSAAASPNADPPAQDHGVDPLHQPGRLQEGRLPGGRGPAPDLAGPDRARRRPDDRDAGVGPGPVPDPDTGDGGDLSSMRARGAQPK